VEAGRSPIVRGAGLALVAAVMFGATTPLVALAGRDVGVAWTAALLYAGAAASALASRLVRGAGGSLGRAQVPRLLLVAFFGAAVAPVLLAWGLKRAGGMTGSLALNLEAVFTVLLARAFYGEPIGRRVGVAVGLMVVAGALLAVDASAALGGSPLGALAVGGATLAWALDNALTRPLSDGDPVAVVGAKGALGALLTTAAALAMGEARPALGPAVALLACGATGYGLSLRFYLLAQRHIGAARTGSIFATAPFVGAALGWMLGFRAAGLLTLASAALFAVAVALHLTERHGHRHRHERIDHDHAHRHDDGHHDHVHVPPFRGEHAHPHHHDAMEHAHEHAPDVHHGHTHGGA
jgi:drug/metabolite transporter (DMT)-like permease